jgi:hypothetical protein
MNFFLTFFVLTSGTNIYEFATVFNQYDSFICLDLMVKNREISLEMYFKW